MIVPLFLGRKGALTPKLPFGQCLLVGGAVQLAEILFHSFPKVVVLHYFCPSAPRCTAFCEGNRHNPSYLRNRFSAVHQNCG